MNLCDLTNKELIKTDINCTDKKEAIKELAKLLHDKGIINSLDRFIADVYEREEEYSTGFGEGVAVPHAKSDTVKKSAIAVGKCKGIEWNAIDNKPVKVIILIAVPKSKASEEHLIIISKLAEMLMDDDFVNNLLNSYDKEDIYNLLKVTNID